MASSKHIAYSMLFLRIVALAAAAVTVALLYTNSVTFDDGSKLRYQDFKAYRFEVIATIIAGAYCLVQLPLGIYYAVQQKRLIRNGFLAEYDFLGDKVISVLLAAAAGVGFAVSVEFKKFLDEIFDSVGTAKNDPTRTTYDKFFNRGILASSILLVACVSMVIVSILSSIILGRSKSALIK